MLKNEFYFLSKDGKTQIHGEEWIPDGEVLAVLQIIHGMAEHIDRYDEFARYLAERGIYVTGHSHLGHGKSISDFDKLGYFHSPNGNACLIGDIQELRNITKEKYPDKPYYMLGHSMGSFLLRQYLGNYGEGLSGAIIMGTGNQPEFAVKMGMKVCKSLAAFKGWDYRSNFVDQLVTGVYEKKNGKSWLSRNEENVKRYVADPYCGFVFTLNAFYHMFAGMQMMNQQEKEGKILRDLPVIFMAGSEDPVGTCGKGVQKVYQRYLKQGAKQAQIKLYEGDRHEILNEFDRMKIYEDILEWINNRQENIHGDESCSY